MKRLLMRQVYVARADGSEARPVTSLTKGHGYFPD